MKDGWQESQPQRKKCENRRVWSNAEVGFEDGGRGHEQRNVGRHSKLEKTRKWISV